MVQPDASLGLDVDFDNEGFKRAIRFAMQMGKNPEEDRRPKFVRRSSTVTYWLNNVELSSAPRMDRDGKPLNPDIEVRRPADTFLEVDCAIEVVKADAEELPVGNFRPTKIIVTLLAEQYAEVEGCREMVYNGDRYVFGYEPESNGLFDVGVYSLIWYAKDET